LALPDSTKLTAQNKAAKPRAACQVRESSFVQTTSFICLFAFTKDEIQLKKNKI
jgi:hypothetical protein